MKKNEIARYSLPAWIAILGSATLFVATAMRSSETPQADARAPRRPRPESPRPETPNPEVRPPEPAAPSPLPEPESVPSRAPEAAPVALPDYVENDVLLLQAWILALPEEVFSRIVGTRELDRLVARVVEMLTPLDVQTPPPPQEIDEFLTRLNARVMSVSKKG